MHTRLFKLNCRNENVQNSFLFEVPKISKKRYSLPTIQSKKLYVSQSIQVHTTHWSAQVGLQKHMVTLIFIFYTQHFHIAKTSLTLNVVMLLKQLRHDIAIVSCLQPSVLNPKH
jgi:hypothetical protein